MPDPADPSAPDARAEQLIRQGAYAEAAAELRRIGELARAQQMYERIWDFRSAAEVARERGDRPALLRLLLETRDSSEVQLLHVQLLQAPPPERQAAAAVYEGRRLWAEAAELRESLGELPAARDLYLKARRRLDAGRLGEHLGEAREAGLVYEELLAAGDGSPAERAQAHLGLGRVLRRFGRHEDAVRHLQRSRRLGPGALEDEIDRLLLDSLRALGYGAVAARVEARMRARGRVTAEVQAIRAGEDDLLLGRYRPVRLLGSGGAGRVYLAEDTLQRRQVALKIVPPPAGPDAAGGEAAESYRRFLREAQAAGALRHPHIVSVHEAHEAEGLLVMEYLPGGTLGERPLPLPGTLGRRVLLQVLDALAAAHAGGLIHRDIKPQNIFLSATTEAKLGDFGVAHLQDLHATQTAGFVGTLAYMAPEQIAGAPLSFATDVYALGATAFQLATGRLPFAGPDFVGQHLGEAPPAPSALRPGLDPAWDALCLRALQKRPADRFASLDEMRQAVLALPRQDSGVAASAAAPSTATPERPRDDPFRLDARIADAPHARLWLGTDTRLGRQVLIEEFAPGLLQGEGGAAHLRWLRLMARLGGPGLQRVLRIDLEPAAARAVYEAPVGAYVEMGGLSSAEAEALRRLLLRAHLAGAAHGAVAGSLLREEFGPVLLVAGRGPLTWPAAEERTAAADLAALDALAGRSG